jgi:hypothetical protein
MAASRNRGNAVDAAELPPPSPEDIQRVVTSLNLKCPLQLPFPFPHLYFGVTCARSSVTPPPPPPPPPSTTADGNVLFACTRSHWAACLPLLLRTQKAQPNCRCGYPSSPSLVSITDPPLAFTQAYLSACRAARCIPRNPPPVQPLPDMTHAAAAQTCKL